MQKKAKYPVFANIWDISLTKVRIQFFHLIDRFNVAKIMKNNYFVKSGVVFYFPISATSVVATDSRTDLSGAF